MAEKISNKISNKMHSIQTKLKRLLILLSLFILNNQLGLSQDSIFRIKAKVEYIDSSSLKQLAPIVGMVSLDTFGCPGISGFYLVLIKDDNNCKYVARVYDDFEIKIKQGQSYSFTIKMRETSTTNTLSRFSDTTYPICVGFVLREYYSKIYCIQSVDR